MNKKFNPHSPDCSVGMTELQASRWLEKQPGMVCTPQENERVVLFKQGVLLVEGKGILGAVLAARKVLAEITIKKVGGCS